MAKTKTQASDEEVERLRKLNAARQARHRQKNVVDGDKKRLSIFMQYDAHYQLERIARHRGLSITALIEEFADKEEIRITARMTATQKKEYFADTQ
jgi:predicted DNA-binding ribbon-helix-helix protein